MLSRLKCADAEPDTYGDILKLQLLRLRTCESYTILSGELEMSVGVA
jgi:hypothetical protein